MRDVRDPDIADPDVLRFQLLVQLVPERLV
jgi:hypothetical protein